jgi:hypothetical protein
MGLDLACVMPGSVSLSLFAGALLAWLVKKAWRRSRRRGHSAQGFPHVEMRNGR